MDVCIIHTHTHTHTQDLTQYNTAHNRQISMVGINENEKPRKRRNRPRSIAFAEEEEVINPEDVDPSIGKFRNMITTTILPTKVYIQHTSMILIVYNKGITVCTSPVIRNRSWKEVVRKSPPLQVLPSISSLSHSGLPLLSIRT